ncbi:sensor histidine kinase [Roseateles amylovorans]|uniref:histidine kinase n=1 Tax=Roseateles amylovorans TaxID=2978473 RepID=A0ABY6B304_9BURK|nr:sensor histidine kinase [Roseateles amylovorans]UXH79604.1 histidine kinase [Roseateles amylovorans]
MSSSFLRPGWTLLAAFVWMGMAPAWALDRDRTLDQFHHTRWTTKDGAPLGIRKMSQTRDGWLWLGTTSGLFRFDGVRFERLAPIDDPGFGERPVSTVAAGAQGELWVGLLAGGIARIDAQGRPTTFALPDDLPSRQTLGLSVLPNGLVWANVGGELLVYEGTTWQRAGADWGWPATSVTGTFVDAAGGLWVISPKGWFRLRAGSHRFETVDRHDPAPRSARIIDGQSWLIFNDRVQPLPDTGARNAQAPPQPDSSSIYVDRARNLWSVYCPAGLCRSRLPTGHRMADGAFSLPPVEEQFDRRDGLSSDIGMTVLEDRDGSLWVATQTGLDRFRDTLLARFSPSGSATNFVLQPEPEGLLLGAVEATRGPMLWRWRARRWRQLPWPSEGGRIRALLRDPSGTEWLGTSSGVWRLEGDAAHRLPLLDPTGPHDCRQLARNRQGLWALFHQKGLRLLRDSEWQPAPMRGLEAEQPTAFALEGEGTVWTGYPTNRLIRSDALGSTAFGPDHGLDVGAVTFLHVGHRLLVVGDRGLQLRVGDRFHALRSDEEEALRGVTGAHESPDGDLWLNGLRGAVRISAKALLAFDHDPSRPVPLQVFDSADGYPSGATALAPASSLVADATGALWFAGLDGVARLDPRQLPPPRRAPPVVWLEAAADQHWKPYREGLDLPAGTQTVSVRFTTLDLGLTEQLRFQARLEGVDKDWRELGPQRELSYSHLPAGRHRLEVRAVVGHGLSAQAMDAPAPATMRFFLQPTLTQTLWFRSFAAVAVLLLLALGVRWRTRVVARHEQRLMRLRMDEREQIAQDIHDTLLQGVHGLTLHFQKVANRMSGGDPNRALMDAALDRADQLIERGREQVAALRAAPAPAPDLAAALSDFGERLAADGGARFLLDVDGPPRQLRPHARDQLLRIGEDAIANAFQHSHATEIRVTVTYRWNGLRLQVTDNGIGMARPRVDNDRIGSVANGGLARLSDRSVGLSGRARIHSAPGDGTTLTMRFPAWGVFERPWWPIAVDCED